MANVSAKVAKDFPFVVLWLRVFKRVLLSSWVEPDGIKCRMKWSVTRVRGQTEHLLSLIFAAAERCECCAEEDEEEEEEEEETKHKREKKIRGDNIPFYDEPIFFLSTSSILSVCLCLFFFFFFFWSYRESQEPIWTKQEEDSLPCTRVATSNFNWSKETAQFRLELRSPVWAPLLAKLKPNRTEPNRTGSGQTG